MASGDQLGGLEALDEVLKVVGEAVDDERRHAADVALAGAYL